MENMFLIEKNGVKFYLTVRDLIRMLYGLERYDFRWEVEEECKDWILPFRKEDPELLSFSKPEVTNRGEDYVMSYDMFSLPIKNEKCFFMNDIPVAEFTGNVFLSDGLDTNDYYYFLLRVDDKFVMLDLTSVGTCLCFAAENGILAGEIPESHWFHFVLRLKISKSITRIVRFHFIHGKRRNREKKKGEMYEIFQTKARTRKFYLSDC